MQWQKWICVPGTWHTQALLYSMELALGTSARHSILQRPVMFFCPESVLLDIFIGDFDEDKESIFMKLGDSA